MGLLRLAGQLKKQPLLWAPAQTLYQLKAEYKIPAEEEVVPDDFVGEGYYYDSKSQLFYLSRELYENSKDMTA